MSRSSTTLSATSSTDRSGEPLSSRAAAAQTPRLGRPVRFTPPADTLSSDHPRRTYSGSQRQPLLFSQTIALPSPATPLIPWSALGQYSPGS
jgi:hypothetical protein